MAPSLLVGSEAERDMVMSSLGDYHPIRHFACHAKYNESDPLMSGIYVAHDDLCSVADFLRRSSAFRLTVLSCCESGLAGPAIIGDNFGLPGLLMATDTAAQHFDEFQI
ncbi:hypothetical protein XH81_04005 [Bradyrhizobium sp. CCBAU 25360]|nr:hypothetical protein [Bradyrhizobium sp. CCBAU 25360]